jgi:ferredoxin
MMKMAKKVIRIDEDKCTGCGTCVNACHENAIKLVNGKAKLVSESYCDGLGACLPTCPSGAISLVDRELGTSDKSQNVTKDIKKGTSTQDEKLACGCPGMQVKNIERKNSSHTTINPAIEVESQLRQWPCQIKLVPVNAPYFEKAHLLIAADCTAYAYANIHQDFMRNKITIIGCPKLDATDYSEKLTEILKHNDIKSVTALRMQVPCCGGLVQAVKQALINSGKMIPWSIITIGMDGNIVED